MSRQDNYVISIREELHAQEVNPEFPTPATYFRYNIFRSTRWDLVTDDERWDRQNSLSE